MNNDNKKLKRFGRYLLLDHLVDGGMAKISRARFLSEDVDRIVVIKMVQPKFSNDKKFKGMLLDEIKLNFGFNHPNIAQTYDYGFYKDQIYTAMEFVDGKNLKEFTNCLKKKNCVFPIDVAVYVISQACRGLSYAHNFKDKLSGKKLNIIHRDISPHNIMLNFEGSIKIIDFGIAKTNSKEDTTKAGTIKGKLSYLAPEYLLGKELDHRYDQFAIGITLWELLCSQKLFNSKEGISIFREIESCEISSPSHINPNVPKELDDIVLRSLLRNREDRFPDIEELARELEKFLYSHYPAFNTSQVVSFARSLFEDEILKDQSKFVEFGKINIAPYIEDWKNEVSNSYKGKDHKLEEFDCGVKEVKSISEILNDQSVDIEFLPHNNLDISGAGNTAIRQIAHERWTDTAKYKNFDNRDHESDVVTKRKRRRMVFISLIILCLISFQGKKIIEHPKIFPYLIEVVPWVYSYRQNPSRRIASSQEDVLKGSLKLRGFKNNSQHLYINGEIVEYQLFSIKLPLNNHYKIVIIEEGRKPFASEFLLTEDQPNMSFKIPELPLALWGEINIATPPGGILEFDFMGIKITKDIPVSSLSLPSGTYSGVIKHPLRETEIVISFEVKEGQRTLLDF